MSGWTSPAASLDRITLVDGDLFGVLQSAGFMFFAFAGYARIATLGEEVRDPEVTIPKAVPRALGAVLVLYAVVGVTALAVVDADLLAATDAPLRLVADAGDLPLGGVVRIGAGIAALGVLLNLIPGVSRTTLAMARNRELPHWFAHVDTGRSMPIRAELTVAAVVIALVVLLELRNAIAVSGVAVLTYYAITNASALTLTVEQRRWPRAFPVLGLVGCVVLIVALPWRAVVTGVAVLVAGAVVRVMTSPRRSPT